MAKRIPWRSKADLRKDLAAALARTHELEKRLADVTALARLQWFADQTSAEREAALDKVAGLSTDAAFFESMRTARSRYHG